MLTKQTKGYLFLVALAIFFVILSVFVISSVKIAGFSLDSDEVEVLEGLNKTITAIDGKTQIFAAVQAARGQQSSVFVNVISQAVNQVAKGNPLILRLPGSLAFLLSLITFYLILRNLKVRSLLIFMAAPLTSYLLWHFAGKLSYEIWFSLFSLLGFWAGFRFFFWDKEEDKLWSGFIIGLFFLILPTIHFFALIHILFLDLAFLTLIILIKKDWLRRLGELLFLNLFLIIPLSVWADVTIGFFKKLSPANLVPVQEIFYRLWGGNGLFALLGTALFVIVISATIRKIWLPRKKEGLSSTEYYFAFNLFYLIYLFIGLTAFPILRVPLGDNYLFLIWPFFSCFLIGMNYFLAEGGRWAPALKIVLFGIIVSNFLNLGAMVASGGFENWKGLVGSIKQTDKTLITTNSRQWLRGGEFYWKESGLAIDEVHRHEELEARINQWGDNMVIILVSDKAQLSRDIERLAQAHFGKKESPWENKATKILLERNLNPHLKNSYLTKETLPILFFEKNE